MRLQRYVGLTVLMLSCVAAAPQGDDVTIRRTLVPKAAAGYHMDGDLSQTITIPSGMTQTSTTAVSTEFTITGGDELEDGKLPITVDVRDFELKTTPEPDVDMKIKKATMEAKIDALNNMSDVTIAGIGKKDQLVASLIARMVQGGGTFPDHPVDEGDTWTVSEQASFLGSKKLQYDLRYDGEEEEGDETYWALSADTTVPVEVDPGTMEGEGSGMVMKGTVHILAHVLLDKDGLLHSMLFNTKAEMTLDAPQAAGQIQIASDEVMRVNRTP